MILTLHRTTFDAKSTLGDLSLDGVFFCHTLEPRVRYGPKIPGRTAIPAGSYNVVIDMSARFKRLMPHVLDVPGFEGIRIHSGNTDADTAGCILLGKVAGKDWIGESRAAFEAFFPKLQQALAQGPVRLVITDEPETASDPDGEVSGAGG